MLDIAYLKQRQGLPLEGKIILSQKKIREFYDHFNGDVYVSFSGGKDSTVLLDLVRSIYPHVPAVFVDTGLEYPEIKAFVRTIDNVIWIKPDMAFTEVIKKYGFPVASKKIAGMIRVLQHPTKNNAASRRLYLDGIRKDGSAGKYKIPKKWKKLVTSGFKVSDHCCHIMKKKPIKQYEKQHKRVGFVGTMASDSEQRKLGYLISGCNTLEGKKKSRPMSFWFTSDVWDYIKSKNLPYCDVYRNSFIQATGCMFCMFGVHLEGTPNRFQVMYDSHPKLWDYCINKLGCGKILDFIGVKYIPDAYTYQI